MNPRQNYQQYRKLLPTFNPPVLPYLYAVTHQVTHSLLVEAILPYLPSLKMEIKTPQMDL